MLVALASAVLASVIAVAQGVPAGVKTIPLSEVEWVAQPNGLVVSGTHYVGQGDKFDEAKLNAHSSAPSSRSQRTHRTSA
jgi:hypothetical protein